jgi:hypothetical protein
VPVAGVDVVELVATSDDKVAPPAIVWGDARMTR